MFNICKWASCFSQKYASNVQNNLFSSLAGRIWPYLLFPKHLYTTSCFDGHIGFLKKTVILWTIDINFRIYAYFNVREVTALIWSYLFQLLNHFQFWRPFWIFLFSPFFDQKVLSKCANDAYFHSQEVKLYQIATLNENKIPQGDVNIFSHLLFFFIYFLKKNRSDKNRHHYQSV